MRKVKSRTVISLCTWLIGALLGMGLSMQGTAIRADSLPLKSSIHIFLYEPSGPCHDVTSTVSIWEDHVYLYDPAPIEVVLNIEEMVVLDTNGNQIGYMAQVSQPSL